MTLLLFFALFVATVCLWSVLPARAAAPQEQSEAITFVKGLDGGDYLPYKATVVQKVQEALKQEGLYAREVNGELDEPTMKAIGEFQRENNLTVSGVPSPATRKLLLEE
jgi:peptidoglycan hydrolase-like protein with peptidoglycan-binding domain